MENDDEYYLGVKITKLPPGKAFGADELKRWGFRRLLGQSGADDSSKDRAVVMECVRCRKVADVMVHIRKEAKNYGMKCRSCGRKMRFIRFKKRGVRV